MVMGLGRSANDEIVSKCPICLEPMDYKGDNRTLVKLRCDHQFHIDCIGSAFNAKNKMECPLCRNVEQGRWLYATGLPVSDFNVDIVENRIPEPPIGVFTNLAFGMELCPFVAYGQFNPFGHHNMLCPNIMNHQLGPGGGPLCPYIEYTITFPQSRNTVGVNESTNFSNQTIYGSEDVSHRSNPSHRSDPSHHLVPLSHLPTNPRVFRSVLEPEVIRSRHYFIHPLSNPDPTGGFSNSISNVSMFPPHPGGRLVLNAPAVRPYLGGSLVTNASIAQTNVGRNLSFNANVATASIAQPYQDGSSLANAPVVRSDLSGILFTNAPVANAPIARPNIGDNLWGSAAIANASMASPYQAGNSLANAPMVWPNLLSRGNGSYVFGGGESSNSVNNGVGSGNGTSG